MEKVELKNKLKVFSNSFSPDVKMYFNSKVNLYVDYLATPPQGEHNILWLCEPNVISNLKSGLDRVANLYEVILTFDEDVLAKYNHAHMHLQASSWITLKDYSPKEFNISMVIGNKMMASGHVVRQKLWHKQEKINNRKFYIGAFGHPENTFNCPMLYKGVKDPMFFSQFHIAIENCSIKNYFSEKIVDCFVSKTVPIYWGCKNIGDFFNEKGIIVFENAEEAIAKCNAITENTYNEMLPYVEENYLKAQEFTDWMKNLTHTINSLHFD
jgi:hypothetical protein